MASVRQDNIQINIAVNGKESGETLKDLKDQARQMNRELDRLVPGTEAFINKTKDLQSVNGQLDDIKIQLRGLKDSFAGADGSVNQLTKSVNELETELKQLAPGTEAFVKKAAELQKTSKQLHDAKQAMKGFAEEIRHAEGSIADLTKKADLLSREIAELAPGTQAFAAKSKELQAVQKRLDDVKKSVKGIDDSLEKGGNSWTSFIGKAAGIAGIAFGIQAVVGAVIGFAKASLEAFKKFEAGLSNLKAITGASTEDMKFYEAAAKQIGKTTTQSAAETVEAFKLIGSAKPELLENRDALVAVTKEAITLAEAAGMQVPEAATALTGALNQFGEGADQASRYINVMAAGAKLGSSEINETAAALKNSGTVAAAAGVSFEQTNASIQALAEISIKGGEAGTGLRNVLLTLQAGADSTNPKVVGLEKALENLGNKNLTAAQLTKLFGKENVVVAQQMINSREKIAELTKGLTGTSTAYQQAAENTDNFEAKQKKLSNALEIVQIELIERFAPAITEVTEFFTKLLDSTGPVGEVFGSFVSAIDSVVSSFGSLLTNLFPFLEGVDKGTFLMKGLALAFNIALTPIKFFAANLQLAYDGLNIILNKGKEVMNFFGTDFKLDPKANFDTLEKNALANAKNIKDSFVNIFTDKPAAKAADPAKTGAGKGKVAGGDPNAEVDALSEKEQKALERAAEKRRKAAEKEKKAREKEAEELLKAQENAAKRLEDLEVQNIEDEALRKQAKAALDAEREINEVNASKATAEQKAQLLVAIDKRLMQELAGIDQEYNAKKLKEQEDLAKKELELANKSAIAKADLGILLAGKNEQKLFDARVAKIETLRDIELQNVLLTEDEKLIIQRKSEAEIDALREENHQKEKERRREIGEAVVNLAQGGLQAISDFGNISTNKEIAQAEQVKSTKIKKLDQELKSKKITQDQYNAAKALAEQEADQKTTALKRKQAETDKKVALGQAFIATALAVTKALPNIPLAVIAGLMGGLNIAKIAATPVQFAKGSLFQRLGNGIRKLATGGAGFFKNAGVPQGPTHAQGGIDLINNVTGERLAEMEGNEPIMVLSRNTYANNRPVVDSLLDSSLHRNGAKIKLATGAVLGDLGSSKPSGSVGLEPGADETVGLLRDIREALMQYPTLLRAVVTLTDLEEQKTLREALKSDANLTGKAA